MLKNKHLQPWLLIYLTVSLILLLTTVALIVVIVLDQITGFNFIYGSFSSCQISSNYKFNFFMQISLRCSFILSILASTLALAQTGMAIFYFVKFKSNLGSKQDEKQDQNFEDLTKNNLIMLYVFNTVGLLSLTSVCGSYISFYIELNQCSNPENLSSSIQISLFIGGSALIFSMVSLLILMKLLYHFNEQLQKNHGDQSSKQQNSRARKEKYENLHTIRNMLQLKGSLNQLSMGRSKNKHYNSLSTDQQSPRDFMQNLLDSHKKNTYSPSSQNTIFGNTTKLNQNRVDGNKIKLDHEDQSDDYRNINEQKIDRKIPQGYIPNSSANYPRNSESRKQNQISANSVIAQQKKLMRKMPKYPYNKKSLKIDISDIIFQQESSDQQQKQEHNNHSQSPRNMQGYPQSSTNMSGNQANNHYGESGSPIKNEQSNTSPPNNVPNTTSEQNRKESEIIRTKYLNSPYLKHLQNKNITPQERRNIKKKHLKIDSTILEFDAKDYQVDQISQEDRLSSNISRKKSQRKTQNPKNNTLNTPDQIQSINNHQYQQNDISNSPNSLIFDSSLRKKEKIHPKRFSNTKSAAYILERSRIEEKKLQDQNPIHGYVQQDEGYDEHIQKILQFEKFNRRKRKDIYNPFQEIYVQDKTNEGKLYLHKNKIDQFNRNQQKDEQVGFDPFHDDLYEDEIYIQRQLMIEREQTAKNSLNGISSLKIMPKQPDNIFAAVSTAIKKSTRKDGVLLDFIRSKYTMD